MTLKFKSLAVAASLCAGLFASGAQAVTITFDELTAGSILSTQYAALGVTFSANAFTGANSNSTTQGWATNTDMTIVALSGSDVGGLGTPTLVSGNVLHSFNGWLAENGDGSFAANFSAAISTFSVDFAGVSTPADTAIYVYNGNTLLSTVAGTATTGQFTLSYNAPSITKVVIAAGSYSDWAAVDNITYTLAPVPEPETYGLMALGLAGVMVAVRRRSASKQA